MKKKIDFKFMLLKQVYCKNHMSDEYWYETGKFKIEFNNIQLKINVENKNSKLNTKIKNIN
jgi:hypothetical protein